MGFYDDQIVPRMLHFSMNMKPFAEVRQKALAPAAGTVLEIGFGSGLNVPWYPATVAGLKAVEPSTVARKLGAKAMAASPFPIEMIGLDGQQLAVETGTIDTVVSTWTLCTIPDAGAALREVARVLKPGGRFLFVEHGLSPDPGVAKWQGRLDRLQGWLFGGCHLNRDMKALIGGSTLRLESLENMYLPGPRTHGYLHQGVARKN
jgi:ubiquinone/menaquinone biosynthesis C-methylase UbiE